MASPPKAGNRTVLLPALVLRVLKACKKANHPRWMFPSPSRRTLRWTQPPSGSGGLPPEDPAAETARSPGTGRPGRLYPAS